jgi:DNA invertase Pin-like site-specific DNA recombinase
MGRNCEDKIVRAALYGRVSTVGHGQDPETQMQPLREMAGRRGWKVMGEFTDAGVSGTKRERPELDRLMALVRKRRIDAVVVWKFDRFARSVSHLLTALEEFKLYCVDFISVTESVDSSTPMGKMIFVVVAAIAEFERDIIRERVKAGVHRAQAEGKHCGRPRKQIDLRAARELLGNGHSVRQVSEMLGIPRSSLRRKLADKPSGPKVSQNVLPECAGENRAATVGH